MRGNRRWIGNLEEAKGKRKEQTEKSTDIPGRYDPCVKTDYWERAARHGPRPLKRRGGRNGQGPRCCHDGSGQMGGRAWGFAMRKGVIRMSHALLT